MITSSISWYDGRADRDQDGREKGHAEKVFPGCVLVKMIATDRSWYV